MFEFEHALLAWFNNLTDEEIKNLPKTDIDMIVDFVKSDNVFLRAAEQRNVTLRVNRTFFTYEDK